MLPLFADLLFPPVVKLLGVLDAVIFGTICGGNNSAASEIPGEVAFEVVINFSILFIWCLIYAQGALLCVWGT